MSQPTQADSHADAVKQQQGDGTPQPKAPAPKAEPKDKRRNCTPSWMQDGVDVM